MNKLSRRKIITTGIAATAGVSGLAVAAKLAGGYGLIPPDSGGIYGPGETLTYAAQRVLTRHTLAREFSPSQISKDPFANPVDPLGEEFLRFQSAAFADWRLVVDGMITRPASFSVAELKSLPARTQITMIGCEEGWTYIGEWTGVPLSHILELVGTLPQARYVVYRSIQPEAWDSIDMTEALHPQTLIAYGMNGGDLPPDHGAPVRLRLTRQLGYKNVKYLSRIVLADSMDKFGGTRTGTGTATWYGGI